MLPTTRCRSDISLKEAFCCPGAMTRRWHSQTRYTPRPNTASIMKDLIDLGLITFFLVNKLYSQLQGLPQSIQKLDDVGHSRLKINRTPIN